MSPAPRRRNAAWSPATLPLTLKSLLLEGVSWALTLGQLEPPIGCRS